MMNAASAPSRQPLASGLWLVGLWLLVTVLGGCHKAPSVGIAPTSQANAGSTAVEGDAGEGVTLNADEVERLGINTAEAKPALHTLSVAGYGLVVPHETLAQSLSELLIAAAAAKQSSATLVRIQHLAGTPGAMGTDIQDTAMRQDTVDRAALSLARQRSSATFGQSPPWKEDFNSATLAALADGQIKLVRVTFPLGSLGEKSPSMLRLARITGGGADKGWKSAALWDAPADTNVPGKSFFALLKASDAGEGERLLAWGPIGEPVAGVQIPATAAIISGGKYWCYLEDTPGHFVRVEIDTSMPVGDEYFVHDGIAPGDRIVASAAGLLLARETNPSTPAAD
jgi:hypothetical protein